ncbi:MAG: GDYXXLXY domain-containing protein [Bryobacteraceae bacterium]
MNRRGLLLGALQLGGILAIAGRFWLDRSRLPRAWVKTAPFDPHTPLRGRYVRLRLDVTPDAPLPPGTGYVTLSARDGKLMISPSATPGHFVVHNAEGRILLSEPLAYFIPDDVPDPSRREPGEELWVEVSVPPRGAPRPVRLAVKRGETFTPLAMP